MSSSYAPMLAFTTNIGYDEVRDERIVIANADVMYLTKAQALAFAADLHQLAETLPDDEP